MSKALIIFSGFNPRAVIAFLRTLESNDLKYGIIAKSPEDDIFLTEYANRVLSTRSIQQLELDDLVKSIRKLQGQLIADEYIVAPSTEALNRFLLDNITALEELGCTLPLVNKVLYETVSDKHAFSELCRGEGILVPNEFEDVANTKPPFVAKPKTYFSKDNQVHPPSLIFNNADKDNFLVSLGVDNFYFQEYIEGDSFYLLYYFYENGDVAKFSQVNLMQQPQGKSVVGAESTDLHLSPQSDPYEKLFKSVSFRGLVMVEVKRMYGEFYMIEANPRFWGPSQLFVDADINLFESFLSDYGVLPQRPTFNHKEKAKYFWYGGISYTDGEPQLTFHSYSKTELETDFTDWRAADIYDRNDTRKLYEVEIRRSQ